MKLFLHDKQTLFWVVFYFLVAAVFAETVKLKNDDSISGKLWRITPGFVLVESPYGIFKIPQKFVNAIDFDTDTSRRKVFLKHRRDSLRREKYESAWHLFSHKKKLQENSELILVTVLNVLETSELTRRQKNEDKSNWPQGFLVATEKPAGRPGKKTYATMAKRQSS